MKQLMKFLFYVAVVACFSTACSDDNEKEPPAGEAKMLSFGFFEEDNEGILLRDYVVENITTTNIKVTMPKEVNKTSLIARFTVTENDVVTVGGTIQVSGTTVNNFSIPVDYIVTEGSNNTRYTVSIEKGSDAVWTQMPSFTADVTAGIYMKVNPSTGQPYIAFQQSRTETADRKVSMIKWSGNAWEFVGNAAGISEGRADVMSFDFDASNNIYLSYKDYLTTPAQDVSVKSFNGSTWSSVGTQGIIGVRTNYITVALDPEGIPTIFCMNDAAAGLPRRALNIARYTGGSWNIDNTIPGRANTIYAWYPKTKLVDGVLYVGIFNASSSSYSVYTYTNNTWTTIAEEKVEIEGAKCHTRDFDMDVDAAGNIYIVTADNAPDLGAVYRPRVKKYDAKTQVWSTMGDPIEIDLSTVKYFDIAISPYGIPYLIYRNVQDLATVVAFDDETKNWGTPTNLTNYEVDDVWLDFAPDGIGYAAIVVDNNIVTFKYDTPQ